ncbi:MAG: tetraacyldisaccharide 4'-kinase [Rickettsia endosymbiont of Bryobia graminum]|nr:tetraacyldisaccharide 4'-kinase [Rickettsia endosymbiont of Bryobia graminum]
MIKLLYPKFWQTRNIISYVLLPFSWIYFLASYIRKAISNPIRFPCKVICVGNITIGGTGKTQIVAFLARSLKSKNVNFIIITKAYGSKLKGAVLVNPNHTALEVGDESVMLLEYGLVIAAKKIGYIKPLIDQLKPSVIIVDDSMQNPNFYKDFTILTIDTDRLFGNKFLIPAGPLRQYPKSAIEKANAIVSVGTNSNNINLSLLNNVGDKLFQAQIIPSIEIDKTKKYFAFSGIGNPQRFFSTLENYGLKLLGYKIFSDHHIYSNNDLKFLANHAKQNNAYLITTRKDYVKIDNNKLPLICCDVNLLISRNQQLIDLIYEKIL